MSSGRQEDPYGSFRFKVEIQGVIEAHFSSVSGLSVSIDVVEQEEGGVNEYTHKLKGQTRYQNIVLKRGVTTSRSFFDWVKKSVNNKETKAARKNGMIVLYGDSGKKEIQKWQFLRAWPCKWEGGNFDTGSSAALLETLELAHEGLE